MNKIIYLLAKVLPFKHHFSDLEKMEMETTLEFNKFSVITAFQKISKSLPFYKKILVDRGIDPKKIKTIEDFHKSVPVLKKEDIFPIFSAQDLCMDGNIDDVMSAIVTSGSSGKFAYGMLTAEDSVFQKKMLDEALDYAFDTKNKKPLIIGALSMGVTFSSSYPVVNTSVRSDIALHLIKTLSPYYGQIIVVTVPHFAKKIIEEAKDLGVDWGTINISFILGGAVNTSNMISYLHETINPPNANFKNIIQGTMGTTELGLNIFSSPPYLFELRDFLQKNPILLKEVFGKHQKTCPEIMYYFPLSHYIEVLNVDSKGYGDLVISNLDTKSKTPLIRYATGDVGKFIDKSKIEELLAKNNANINLKLNLPLIAISGKKNNELGDLGIAIEEIEDCLYKDRGIANEITGHYFVIKLGGNFEVEVQLKKNILPSNGIKGRLENIIKEVLGLDISVNIVAYRDFDHDMELNYENKWKHFNQ